jgi:hypothetical protein
MKRRVAVIALAALALAAVAKDELSVGTWVAVMRRGDVFGIDAVLTAPVPPMVAWDVLSDFDGMAAFVPNLQSSRILSRAGDTLRVEQRGELKWGPVMSSYATEREVLLTPVETIRTTSVAGASPREQSVTRFKAIPGGVEVWHRSELAFRTWMPDYVAQRFLRDVMQERYEAIIAEMVRRNAAGAGSGSHTPPAAGGDRE